MAGRVLSFGKSLHQGTQELLPWFLNGTLEAEEATQVEEHLQACPECRLELESARRLQMAYADSDLPPDAAAALAKLRPKLEAEAPAPRPRRPEHRRGAPAGRVPAGPMPGWFKLALAMQFALIFALGWAVIRPERAALEYHTLSSASAPQHAAGSLVVIFDPAAPQREVARILRLAAGRIVDGPTASNGYVVAVPQGGLQAALTHLRAEPAVVLAEPLEAERGR
ncbi:MAG TPA: zf-HC2 domain-containing protein [Burkholderiaceae bacterium]|nr:zf-HC2 domain-containing protein [Burkholderiaceae bacterium]